MTVILIHTAVALLVTAAGQYQSAHGSSRCFSTSQRPGFKAAHTVEGRYCIFLHMLCSSQLSFPLFHILNRRKHFSTILGRQQKGNNSVVVTMAFFCLQEENDGFFFLV